MSESNLFPYILALLNGDPVRGKTKTVLQLFLIAKDIIRDSVDFKFFPHMFGPYSSIVAEQFNSLIEQGHVVFSKSGNTFLFELTESGQELFKQCGQDKEITKKIQVLKKTTAKHRVKDMLDIIWTKYPEYMINAWGY
ncbi:MAG: hypothetical protein KGD60_15130 [Candidatus Thorarchaeota archaeon]|nr:hypothetical protein [Candidatus Thorarchaeota archaeon]